VTVEMLTEKVTRKLTYLKVDEPHVTILDSDGKNRYSTYVVRQENNETGAIFFYLTFTYKSTLSPSK